MAWADEIAQMHSEVVATFGRTLNVQYLPSALTENPYSGVDSSLGIVNAEISGVCHDVRHTFAAAAAQARLGREVRVIGFLLADLNAANCPQEGLPERGRLRVNEPENEDWWWLDSVEYTGEGRQRIDCTFVKASGPRKPS